MGVFLCASTNLLMLFQGIFIDIFVWLRLIFHYCRYVHTLLISFISTSFDFYCYAKVDTIPSYWFGYTFHLYSSLMFSALFFSLLKFLIVSPFDIYLYSASTIHICTNVSICVEACIMTNIFKNRESKKINVFIFVIFFQR